MAKFQFQLQAVEKVRNLTEQKALEEMSRCQRVYQEKLAEKRALFDKKLEAFTAKNEMMSRDCNIQMIQLQEDYITGLKQRMIQADQAIVRARRFLEQAMRQYIKSRKERMMIDKLKEKALEEFKLEQSRLEQKTLDDLMTMRARLNHGPLSLDEGTEASEEEVA